MGYLFKKSRPYLIILLFFCGNVYADKINSPPPLQDIPVSLQIYLQEIKDNFHRLEVVTTNPDGLRNGKRGDQLLLQIDGSSYITVNTDSSTTWLSYAPL